MKENPLKPKITHHQNEDNFNIEDEEIYCITLKYKEAPYAVFTFLKDKRETPELMPAYLLEELIKKDDRHIFMTYVKATIQLTKMKEFFGAIVKNDDVELSKEQLQSIKNEYKQLSGKNITKTDDELKDKEFLKEVIKNIEISRLLISRKELSEEELKILSKKYLKSEREFGRATESIMLMVITKNDK